MPQSSLVHYLQAQRQLYLSKLPDRLDQLEAALGEFARSGGSAACTEALAQAHKLAGSGGTFGFPEVSESAAAMEKVLMPCQASGGAPDAEGAATLARSMAALRATLAEAETTLPSPLSAEPELPPSQPSARRRHARLIEIVEPDATAAAGLAHRLHQSGYRTRTFAHPSELEEAPADRPAAILVNAALSGDALPVLQKIAHPGLPGSAAVPLVFMASDTRFETRLAAVRAGSVGYFPHPVEVPALLNFLDRITSDEPTRPYRVLIVEDDENLATFYAEVLQSAGMKTLVVIDPTSVMEPLKAFQPDLITCDIYMPGCNGMELAGVIRQQEEFVRIPIVFLSTETSLDKQSQALKQGGDDFIIKPVAPASLISAVQSRARRFRSLLAAEDTLRISEERFRLVFESSLDGFLQTLADGTIVFANQAACDLFEMTEQELRRTGLAGILDPEDPRMHELLAMQGRSGKFRGEITCLRRNGVRFPADISASLHVGGSGESQGSVIFRDITQRKAAENKIMQLNAELETRVERRTAELTAANQELRAFSHSLAHDLRQPYIAINGLASLLEREIAPHLTDRSRHYLNRIRAGVLQMNDCTDSLLSLAQLSQTHTRHETVDLAALSNALLFDFQAQETGRVVELDIQAPMEAQGDPALLQHLLKNLLGNAWKFTSRQPNARISVQAKPGADGKMVYCVGDNGAGFDMAYVDNLFGAFQRLHSPAEFAGAGIGLATARRIVTRHGGRIWAESAPGEGARFFFTLGG